MAAHSLPLVGFAPIPGWGVGYRHDQSMRPRDVLAANLRKLMAAAPKLSRLPLIVEASNGRLSNGTLDRVRRASHATSIDTLEQIAEVFGVEPWQLLVPSLQATPAKEGSREAVKLTGLPDWPFPRVDRAKFLALAPEQRAFIEGMIANELTTLDVGVSQEDLQRFHRAHVSNVKPKQKKRAA